MSGQKLFQISALQKIIFHNSALTEKHPGFVEEWIDGIHQYNVVDVFSDDIDVEQLSRIPLLVGGSIAKAPFLYLYIADLMTLGTNGEVLDGTAIVPAAEGTFQVLANRDNGNVRSLRVRFDNLKANGSHVFIMIMKTGGTIQSERVV